MHEFGHTFKQVIGYAYSIFYDLYLELCALVENFNITHIYIYVCVMKVE
jgi:hypothetical protein